MVLDKCALIKYERKSGQLQPTDLGRVSAYYYVSHTLGLGFGFGHHHLVSREPSP